MRRKSTFRRWSWRTVATVSSGVRHLIRQGVAPPSRNVVQCFSSASRSTATTGSRVSRLSSTVSVKFSDSLAEVEKNVNADVFAMCVLQIANEHAADRGPTGEFPDERLKLLFICAHPAIDRASRTPLMLQTVLGLDAARIASAFLVSPSSMGQRLVRAKAKIKHARIPFDVVRVVLQITHEKCN